MFWLKVILLVAAFGAGFTVVDTYKHAITRAETAEKAADGWKARATSETTRANRAQGDFDAADEIARLRGIALRASNKRLDAANAALAALEAADPVAHKWADTPVPDSVRLLRRRDAGCSLDLSLPCTPRAVGAEGGAPVPGPERPGAVERDKQSEGSVPTERAG